MVIPWNPDIFEPLPAQYGKKKDSSPIKKLHCPTDAQIYNA